MHNKYLLTCLLLFLVTYASYAQNDTRCGTYEKTDAEMQKLPWYNNNAYLQHFYDSLSATFNGNPAYRVEGTNENMFYRIPVKF